MDQNGKSNEKKQNLYLINLKIPLSKIQPYLSHNLDS